MRFRRLPIAAVLVVLLGTASAVGRDTVRRTDGKTVPGNVTTTSPLRVVVVNGALSEEIPVNEIDEVMLDGEPTLLKSARQMVRDGRYQDAIEALGRVQRNTTKAIVQDVDFYTAYAKGQLALANMKSLAQARTALDQFIQANPNSYHNLEASELSGELSVALGDVDKAKEAFVPLARTGWPDYKMRAFAAVGRAELSQKNYQGAQDMFQRAIDESARGDQADQLRQIARVGQARCQIELGKLDQGKAMLMDVVKNAPREDRLLHAYAFNALGHYYRKMGQPKNAIQEYLKVDLLFNSDARQHAEALTNLQQLWTQVKKPSRAEEAASRLRR